MVKPLEVGVTTWSFQIPEVRFEDILSTIKEKTSMNVIQVGAFGKLELTKEIQEKWLKAINSYDFEVVATCVAFLEEDYSDLDTAIATVGFYDPKYFEVRYKHLCDMADLSAALGVNLLTTHMGYIPHDTKSAKYQHMVDVSRNIADALGERNVNLGMEVGGFETAEDLLQFLHKVNRKNVKINYDPANLIRTKITDQIEALETLREHVALVHFKDALFPKSPGGFGDVVALGKGEVKLKEIIEKLKEMSYRNALIIEGEYGYDTVEQVCKARDLIRSFI